MTPFKVPVKRMEREVSQLGACLHLYSAIHTGRVSGNGGAGVHDRPTTFVTVLGRVSSGVGMISSWQGLIQPVGLGGGATGRAPT